MTKRRKRGTVASAVIHLLPCPFCGNDGRDKSSKIAAETEPMPYVIDGREINETMIFVECGACGSRGPFSSVGNDLGRAVDDARSAWNERDSG